ncbi:MAG: hypothetical protein PHV34_22790, partial [Verrucomicrobiae bacterium]|nr:hypothetical protein [Verrucomicrobiae bacterium]
MSNKNQRIDFIRSGGADGAVTELRCGGVSVLRVETNPMTREITALVYGGGKRIAIGWGDRPHFQVSGTKVAVNGSDRCLTQLTTPEFDQQFSYGVTEKMQPTLKIANSGGTWHEFSWDAATKLLLSDVTAENSWRYTIKPGATARDYAAIERKDEKNGAVEAWHKESTGRETERFADGTTRIKYWFVSGGRLAGKTRKVEKISASGTKRIVEQYAYDEQSRLLRELRPDGISRIYSYSPEGYKFSESKNEKPVCVKEFDSQKRIVRRINPDGFIWTYAYSGNRKRVKGTDGKGKVVQMEDYQDGLLMRLEKIGKVTQTYNYYPNTRQLKEVAWSGGRVEQMIYGKDGNLEGVDLNGRPNWRNYKESKGGQTIRVDYGKDGKPYHAWSVETLKQWDLASLLAENPKVGSAEPHFIP